MLGLYIAVLSYFDVVRMKSSPIFFLHLRTGVVRNHRPLIFEICTEVEDRPRLVIGVDGGGSHCLTFDV